MSQEMLFETREESFVWYGEVEWSAKGRSSVFSVNKGYEKKGHEMELTDIE